ncbi:MAG: hypothetical protein AAGF53_14545 [Pseudomonadota bacterium]
MAIMADNWLIEEVADLFDNGISNSVDPRIRINERENYFEKTKLARGAVQIEALFSLLLNIVLRESIVVDDGYAFGWSNTAELNKSLIPLQSLANDGVIDVRNFRDEWDRLDAIRPKIIDELCVTDDLRSITRANIEEYELHKRNADSYMSICLIGGAGMLARSSLLKTNYVGHPHRQALFQEAGLYSAKPDAVRDVIEDIDQVRSSLIQFSTASMRGNQLKINAPAIAIEIIQDSNSVEDIFRVALEYRSKYRRLRDWLSNYQEALDNGDLSTSVRMRTFLKSYLSDAQIDLDLADDSSTSISVSAAWFQFPVSTKPLKRIRSSFGLRSDFSRLLLKGKGEHALRKLLELFDEAGTALGQDVEASVINILKP